MTVGEKRELNYTPALRHLLRRGISLAVLVRIFAAAAAAGVPRDRGPSPLHFPPTTSVVLAAICGLLMLVDLRRRGELVLLLNLGVGSWPIALCAAGPALAIEAGLWAFA